jgi:hypothetical protein
MIEPSDAPVAQPVYMCDHLLSRQYPKWLSEHSPYSQCELNIRIPPTKCVPQQLYYNTFMFLPQRFHEAQNLSGTCWSHCAVGHLQNRFVRSCGHVLASAFPLGRFSAIWASNRYVRGLPCWHDGPRSPHVPAALHVCGLREYALEVRGLARHRRCGA